MKPDSKDLPEGAPESPTPGPESDKRRSILKAVCYLGGLLAAIPAGVPIAGFLWEERMGREKEIWRPVGPIDKFKVGETVAVSFQDASAKPWAGVTDLTGAWLRRESETEFIALTFNCAHLGCPVRWEPSAELFMCPCHGGVYYADGRVAGGPPPRPLARYPVRTRDGQVEIMTEPIPIS